MSLRVTEDETARGGYAFVDLGRRVSRDPLKLSIRRLDVEPRHLGLEAWQPEIAWIEPVSIDNAGATTVVRVGPVIVDKIEEFVPVEIYVQQEGRIGQITWPFVTPSPQSLTGIKVQTDDPAANANELLQAVEKAVETPPPPPPPPPKPEPTPEKPADADKDKEPAKRGRGGLWLLLILLLVLAGGAAAYLRVPAVRGFVDRMIWGPPAPPIPPVVPDPPRPPPGPTAAELQARYDALIRASAPASAFVELGIQAIAAGHGTVAFRAFEWIGPESHPDAAWHLGRFYDPRVTEPAYRGAAAPSVRRAAEYYAMWKSRSPRHAEELRGLCAANPAALAADARLAALCRP